MLLGVSMDPSYSHSLWQTDPQVVDHHGRTQQQAAQEQWVADLANIPVQANQFHSPQPPSVPDSIAANHVASAYRMQSSSIGPNYYQFAAPTPNWYTQPHQFQTYNPQIVSSANSPMLPLPPENTSQPTTIDPSLVMRPPSHSHTYSQYGTGQNAVTPSHLQVFNQHQHFDAQRAQHAAQQTKYYSMQAFNYPSSTPSSATATPTTQTTQSGSAATEGSASSAQSNGIKSPTATATAATVPVPIGPPLLEQVRTLLTARKLDSAPTETAQALMKMLLGENVVADKETRMEVLTRVRDHAPAGFFEVIGENTPMVGLMQSWARGAYKKEELEDTLMPLLQVLDRTPLGVDQLASVSFGKVIAAIRKKPPTSAIGDMASKIEGTWRKLLNTAEQNLAAEANASRKRKSAEPASKPGPTKKVAFSTGAGSSPTATTVKPPNGVKTIPGAKLPSATSTSTAAAASVVKDVKADASFFSAKPKPKLPSFRRIPKPVEPAPTQANTALVSDVAQPMDWDPFADALKSVRKGSPNVKSQSQPSTNSMDVDPRVDGKEPSTSGSGPVAVSAKTGKPKKSVRFAGEGELEKVKWIERAVYEDDGSGSGPYGVHGRSLADLQREEGSLLRHKMLEQVDWVTPSPIANHWAKERGFESTEKDVQAQREASTLAALYQGAPPDTPVEPPSLASLAMDITDPNMVVMMPGDEVAAIMQSTSMTTVQPSLQDLMAQLTGGSLSTVPTATATATTTTPTPAPAPAPEAGVGGNLAELLERLKGTLPSTAPAPDTYGAGSSYSTAPTGPAGYESTDGYSGGGGYGAQPPTGPAHDSYSGGNSLGAYGGGHGSSYGDSGRARGGPPARGRGNRGVPASQNTRRPLCSFFAKGRCRYGEDCDFSHDPSKLAGR